MAVIIIVFESLLFKTMDLVVVFVAVGSVVPQFILLIVAEDDGDIPPLLLIVPLLPLLLVPPDTPLVLLLLLLLLSNPLDVTTSVVVGVVVDAFEFVVLFIIVLSKDNIDFRGLLLLLTGLSFVSKDFVNFCKTKKISSY